MLADRMVCQWAGIERAMNFANHNPAFRPQVESLVNSYFALIDEVAAELERRRVTRTVSLELGRASYLQASISVRSSNGDNRLAPSMNQKGLGPTFDAQ